MSDRRGHSPFCSRWRAGVWRASFVALLVAVLSVTAVSAAWHAGHEAEPDCAVCKLRHQPLADLAGDIQVARLDAPERVVVAGLDELPADTPSAVPARGPPRS